MTFRPPRFLSRSSGSEGGLDRFGIRDEGHGYDVFGASADWIHAVDQACSFFYERWFRVVSRGIENIPKTGPVIVAANHSGTLPFDGAMLWVDVFRKTKPVRVLRPIADHFVLELPFFGTLVTRTGAVGGSRENLRHLLERGEALLVFPEGVPGIAKGFERRYQLCPFRVGHAEFAIRHRAPVVPAAIIGPEEQMPQIGRLPIHVFGAPYIPISLTPFPLPVRYHILYGEPIHLHEAHPPEAADDPDVLDRAALRVQDAIRGLIDEGLAERRGVFR